MIMAYIERKGCVQQNLYLNYVSLQEGFKKISYGSVTTVLVIGGDIGYSASGV